jgi:transposase
MYRVIEVAKMLGVSKVTIYKKINKNKKALKNHIHVRSNITYVDDDGIQIIKDTIESTTSSSPAESVDAIEELTSIIDFLNEQIRIKKDQIARKDEIIDRYRTVSKSNRGKMQYLENKIKEMKIGG